MERQQRSDNQSVMPQALAFNIPVGGNARSQSMCTSFHQSWTCWPSREEHNKSAHVHMPPHIHHCFSMLMLLRRISHQCATGHSPWSVLRSPFCNINYTSIKIFEWGDKDQRHFVKGLWFILALWRKILHLNKVTIADNIRIMWFQILVEFISIDLQIKFIWFCFLGELLLLKIGFW